MSYRCSSDTSSYSINAKPICAISSAIDVNQDTSYKSINAKPASQANHATDLFEAQYKWIIVLRRSLETKIVNNVT